MGNYPKGTFTNPKGPQLGTERVMRGGDFWSAMFEESSCIFRKSKKPEYSGSMIGFRCCSDKE
ncbi:formylglycine-generating enzyme family protein, partial [bacterium]|nr:formylglycine-generating enzyme family protein [bacterium]